MRTAACGTGAQHELLAGQSSAFNCEHERALAPSAQCGIRSDVSKVAITTSGEVLNGKSTDLGLVGQDLTELPFSSFTEHHCRDPRVLEQFQQDVVGRGSQKAIWLTAQKLRDISGRWLDELGRATPMFTQVVADPAQIRV